jgi:hypothetical protein
MFVDEVESSRDPFSLPQCVGQTSPLARSNSIALKEEEEEKYI